MHVMIGSLFCGQNEYSVFFSISVQNTDESVFLEDLYLAAKVKALVYCKHDCFKKVGGLKAP